MSYNTASYGMMIQDARRLEAFSSALQRAIVPGESRVLDIGTGTGFMAFVAASAGAREVVGVEPNPAVEIAIEIARLNGLDDVVTFHKILSTDLDDEPFDIVISDLRGRMPLFQGHVPAIVDARRRLLRPGGQLIASHDVVYCAPVQAAETWHDAVGYWDDNMTGYDMSPAKRITANSIFEFDRQPDNLLSAPVRLAEIDYTTIESPHLVARGVADFRRSGTFHGLSVWFDIVLDDQTRLSNGIGEPRLVYGRPLLPVMEPFEVRSGERLEIELRGQRVREDYVWSWSGGIVDDPSRSFEQSSFDGADLSPTDFARLRLDAAPARSDRGDFVAFVLKQMSGGTSLAEIAQQLHAAHPQVGSPDDAVVFVSHVVARYGRTS